MGQNTHMRRYSLVSNASEADLFFLKGGFLGYWIKSVLDCLSAFWQGVYNPYLAQQYLQLYGVPGSPGTPVYPYGQLGQSVPGGHGYTTMQTYPIPNPHIIQFGGPGVNAMATSPIPSIQSPYHPGNFLPMKSKFFVSAEVFFLFLQ